MIFKETIDSPIGVLGIFADESHILKVEFEADRTELKGNRITELGVQQLHEYFTGNRKNFDLPLAPVGTTFQKKVWAELEKINFGHSINYSQLAIKLGDLKSIRAVGTANGKNPIPIIIPCHRVIGKDGSLVGFAGGIARKEWLLKHEGVIKGSQMSIFDKN